MLPVPTRPAPRRVGVVVENVVTAAPATAAAAVAVAAAAAVAVAAVAIAKKTRRVLCVWQYGTPVVVNLGSCSAC